MVMNILKNLVLALGLAQGLLCQALEPLYFNSDGLFKIALFTDLHYGESPELDLKSDEVQRVVLETEQPDFIVFGGDMVSGWEGKGKAGWFQKRWRQLTAPAREFSIPYAVILGNHDDEANLERRKVLKYDIDTSDGLSYTQQGPPRVGGASNYFIDIFPAPGTPPIQQSTTPITDFTTDTPTTNMAIRTAQDVQPSVEGDAHKNVSVASIKGEKLAPSQQQTESETLTPADELEPAARLWFFDSMNRGCLDAKNSWGCVAPSTINWASSISKTIPIVPTAMAFVHIPIPEAINVWQDSTGPVFGRKGEMSNCQGVNTGLHQFAKEHGVQAVWSGHDHVNDYVGQWDGVRIGYGRKSGYGSYFYGTNAGVPIERGARIIQLRQGKSALNAASWIALESGDKDYQRQVSRLMSDGPSQQLQCVSGAVAVRARAMVVLTSLMLCGVMWLLL